MQPSRNDIQFYSIFTSFCILFLMLAFIAFTVIYIVFFTMYLTNDVVYHWLAWTLTMFFFSILVLEPVMVFVVHVVFRSLVVNLAQRYGIGAHALASTMRYNDVVRKVEVKFVSALRLVACIRIQRWWLAVLDMCKAIQEQTAAAVKIQAIRKTMIHQKKYIKQRKWCMKVEVIDAVDLAEVQLTDEMMSPMVRLQCDTGNQTVLQTKVMWNAHKNAQFGEAFFFDIKDSNALFLSVWSKDTFGEEFVGRGSFEFQPLKNSEPDSREVVSHFCNVVLFGIQHGEKPSWDSPSRGSVNVRVTFLDPLRETNMLEVGGDSNNSGDWMLPKHQMQFALTKMMTRAEEAKAAPTPRAGAHRNIPCGTSDSIVEISRGNDPQVRKPLTTNWGNGLRRVIDARRDAEFREDGQIRKPSTTSGRSGSTDGLGNDAGAEPSIGAMWGNRHREVVNAGSELGIGNRSDTSMLPTGTEDAEEPFKPTVGLPPLRTLRHQGTRADNLGDRQTTATRMPISRSATNAAPVSGLIPTAQSEFVSPHANVFALSSSQPLTGLSSQNENERLREPSPPGTVPDDDDHTKDLV